MRRIARKTLPADMRKKMDGLQKKVDALHLKDELNINARWKSSRQTKPLKAALASLKDMAGAHERCMYCEDSHGTDIEHFWPKATYPERMFQWLNHLLCCTECGRFKGNDFPLAGGIPLLINPTAEDPWAHLDFDPDTGNIVARFDLDSNALSVRGEATVNLLHLASREALATVYRRTHHRLVDVVENAISEKAVAAPTLLKSLRAADDHGLLGWCLVGTGQNIEPFKTLKANHPAVWAVCVKSF